MSGKRINTIRMKRQGGKTGPRQKTCVRKESTGIIDRNEKIGYLLKTNKQQKNEKTTKKEQTEQTVVQGVASPAVFMQPKPKQYHPSKQRQLTQHAGTHLATMGKYLPRSLSPD